MQLRCSFGIEITPRGVRVRDGDILQAKIKSDGQKSGVLYCTLDSLSLSLSLSLTLSLSLSSSLSLFLSLYIYIYILLAQSPSPSFPPSILPARQPTRKRSKHVYSQANDLRCRPLSGARAPACTQVIP